MGTRAIVTFHPDVECDVCGRRLLRGEQSDVFLTGGQRRQVCELCTSRAAHEGWLRESDGHATSARASRPQRGRSLLGKLRQTRRADAARPARETDPSAAGSQPTGSTRGRYDFLDLDVDMPAPGLDEPLGVESLGSESRGGEPSRDQSPAGSPLESQSQERGRGTRSAPTTGDLKVARALAVFNGGEQPRRVAGVARSLGAPSVRVAPVAEAGSIVAIVVAWELCWYRYEVDLGDEAAGVRLAGQGLELEELTAEDRAANAVADERGELALL